MKYKKNDIIEIKMEGFMGIEFPAAATIEDIVYRVRAATGEDQFAEMILTEEELENRLLK